MEINNFNNDHKKKNRIIHFNDRAAQIVLRVQVTRDGQPRVQSGRHVERTEETETRGPGEIELVVAECQLLYQTPGGPYDSVRSHSTGDRVRDGKLDDAVEDGRHVVCCLRGHRNETTTTGPRSS